VETGSHGDCGFRNLIRQGPMCKTVLDLLLSLYHVGVVGRLSHAISVVRDTHTLL